jgi:UDP-N-acetylglucosamine--N-acetylmuramyl-(pentapeptide) pyrophosphoryl-undecaprenol N-acetylglucosamine transferase
VQVIWQTGKIYFQHIKNQLENKDLRKVRVFDFLRQMDLAYAAADVVITRAGALSISELCVAKKPSLLVPSPNVAEDHQTKNALALVNENAALVVKDDEAGNKLVDEALRLVYDESRCEKLSQQIAKLAKPNATKDIVDEIEKMIGIKNEDKAHAVGTIR